MKLMIIDQKKIKMWSTIGSRATFGMALLEMSKKMENLMVLSSDVSTSAGLDRFRKLNPNQYVEVGISEQNFPKPAIVHLVANRYSDSSISINIIFSHFIQQ